MAATAAGAKKLVVKALKRKGDAPAAAGGNDAEGDCASPALGQPQQPPSIAEATWPTLRDFLDAVHSVGYTRHSLQELYRAIEDIVTAKQGALLYERLTQSIKANAAGVIRGLLAGGGAGVSGETTAFLGAVSASWATHCAQLLLIRNVFLYLDRTYVRDTPGAQPIYELGVAVYRDSLLSHADVLGRTISGVLSLVEADRRGQLVDRQLLSSLTRMLGSSAGVGLYASHLQPRLLAEADAFYAADGVACMAAFDVPQYLQHAEAQLRSERERVHAYLDPALSLRPLVSIVEARLVAAHATSLLERGFAPLLDGVRIDDLRRLYALLHRVRRTDDLRRAYGLRTRAAFVDLVAARDEEKDRGIVAALLEYKRTQDRIITASFAGDEAFGAALKSSLEAGVNTRENKPAELIAKFIDALMRGGAKSTAAASVSAVGGGDGGAGAGAGASSASSSSAADGAHGGAGAGSSGSAGGGGGAAEEELDRLLDRVLVLFRSIHGKDVFEAFYKKDLAKRLLLGKSASTDAEKALVARLKAECGSQFTSKLEGMFKDAELSAELMGQYAGSPAQTALAGREARGELPARQPELFVHVLTSSYWPTYKPAPALVPPELAPTLEAFSTFYGAKYSQGRRLAWQHSLGHCVLRATFPSGRKELDVSFYQALVLLLFNGAGAGAGDGGIGFGAIKERTGVEDGELRRTLQSLACGQVRVLRKEPKGRDVGDGDAFHFNAEFKAPLVRLKINTIQAKETKEEADATHERVAADRGYQVDAAIVRVMKTRKTLGHNALLTELFAQLRFPAKAADIKKRIESLIERDYLERDAANPNTYHYLA